MPRLLIVEDNEDSRDGLSRLLQRKGYEVLTAVDGLQGLEAARAKPPDLVVMDMSLPVLDGWEATRQLRADPQTRHIPVIALTAHAMAEDREKAVAAGCNEYETKPVEFARLLSKIQALLGGTITVGLRPELMPPALDMAKVRHLANLAARLDGARPGQWEDDLAEFNRAAGASFVIEDFQGVYGGEDHEDWVRRVLYRQSLTPRADLSRAEMAEIVSRVTACGPGHDFFLELFLVNCKHPSGSDLIFWPNLVPELPRDRAPRAEEIADLAMRGRV